MRSRVPLWAWLLFPLTLGVSLLLVWAMVAFVPATGALMPAPIGVSDGRYGMGDLSCGKAYLETFRDEEIDTAVWYMDVHVLAVVFIDRATGDYAYFVDSDFDGRVDLTGTGQEGDEHPANEFYQMAGCGDGAFR